MASSVGALRASWLLARLRFRRQLNVLKSAYRFRRKSAPKRTATRSKWSSGWLLTLFVVVAMFGNFMNLSYQSFSNMEKALGSIKIPKEIKRGWLGVQTEEVKPGTPGLGSRPPRGAVVTDVTADSPATLAGLRAGDIVVSIDGKDIGNRRDLARIVGASAVGKEVEVVFLREGGEQRKLVSLGVVPEDAQPLLRPIAPAPDGMLAPGVLRGAMFDATLLLLAALFMTLAGREITRPEWDLEWLVTLPLPASTLLWSRLLERMITNAAGLFTLGPFLIVLALECGYGWASPVVALALTFMLLLLVSTFQTLVDTGLRLSLSPSRLRNLHALISIVSVVPLLLAISMALHDNAFVFGWVAALPAWMDYLPTSLAVRALASKDVGSALIWSAIALVEVLAVAAIGYAWLRHQLRNGVVAVGAREGVARTPAAGRPKEAAPRADRALLPAVQRRELRLLGRDRSFMSQTLILPAVVVGSQVYINTNTDIFAGAIEHPANLAAIAFALASYTLMMSAFQTLNAEGQALWLLYCVPRSLESVLWQKAKLWAVAALCYPLAVFAIAIAMSGQISAQFVASAAIVLAGVPIFAVIATALGVFGCDPLAQEVQRRVRPTYTYLYLTIASLYVYSIYASTIWQRLAMMVLTALLALALWQKARDRFDYLLDPAASPPSRVSVSDGLIAALMFFVLQGLVVIAFRLGKAEIAPGMLLFLAFAIAGALTYAVMRLVYWRVRTAGVPRILDIGAQRALLIGAGGGAAAAIAGIAYLYAVSSLNLMPEMRLANGPTDHATLMWFFVLAVIAAPIFEEFIFRGLIFGGLRRSFGVGAATLMSAAIFAIVHPPLSVIPVFFLGVAAALTYERTKMLAGPMLVHAVYNAAILAFQWGFMQ